MMIVGIDEAGRGPLAGPVSVGAVLVRDEVNLLDIFPNLNDSKKLSEKKREVIFSKLEEEVGKGTVQYAVEFESAKAIDEEGISVVIARALSRALSKLAPPSESLQVYLDGSLKAPPEYRQETIIGGDGIIPAIMLASVAAKVVRDRYMQEIASQFPAYDFATHKGYGTKAHTAAIRANGLSLVHRRTFCKNFAQNASIG